MKKPANSKVGGASSSLILESATPQLIHRLSFTHLNELIQLPDDALVEFALGDPSNLVFVSRYAVELPRKEEMERFIAQISKEVAE